MGLDGYDMPRSIQFLTLSLRLCRPRARPPQLLFAFPIVSVDLVEAFACHEVEGTFYLRVDYSVECYTPRFYKMSAYAGTRVLIAHIQQRSRVARSSISKPCPLATKASFCYSLHYAAL